MRQIKEFDCVEMMHRGQAKVKKLLEGKSQEEVIAFYRKRAQEVREEQERRKADALNNAPLR